MSSPAQAASAPEALGQISPISRPLAAIAAGKCAGHRHQRAIKGKFAQHHIAVQKIRRNDAQRREHGERDGQIEMAAFLGKIGGREIDGKPLARQAEADGIEGGAHPLAAFRHRLVGQAHDMKLHLARKKLRLHIDRHGLNALKRHRCHP